MARWRLAAPHYLNVEGTTWEYKEVDRTTGRQKRTNFPVPLHLDPDNPSDWNHVYGKDAGEIIVCDGKDDVNAKDIIFTGEPTPDMVPMDKPAEVLSASLAHKWKHPIESLSGTYADAMLRDFQEELDQVRTQNSGGKVEGMTELLTAMAGMMKQNQDLIAALVATQPKIGAASGTTVTRGR